MEKLEKILSPMANYLNNNKVIQAISKGIMSTMAALMVGAAGSILLNLPIDAYQSFITSCGLNNVFNTLVNVTTNMLALYTAFTIAYAYTAQTKHDPLVAGLLSLLGFFIVTPMVTTGEGYAAVTNLPLSWLGAKGIFVSMFVAIITSLIFIKLSDKGLIIKMPEGVPEFVSKSFTGIIPGLVVGAVFSTLSFLAAQTSYGDVHNVVYTLIGQPLNGIGNSVWTGCLIYTLSGLCWFLGIHGIAVVSAIMPIWMAADAANLAATSAGQVAPNIITYQWINAVSSPGGAGATIGLVICILLFAKSKRYKTFGKVATIPSIVNINEPVVFGMRSADDTVCRPNYYISLDKRHSGNTGYRSGRFPVWEGLGIYFCKAFLWNPSLYPDIRIRNSGGNPHRSSDWTAMCYFSGKDVPKES